MTASEIAVERTDLALTRSLVAAKRTLAGCIRTGLSMLFFGFTIYEFLLHVKESVVVRTFLSWSFTAEIEDFSRGGLHDLKRIE